VIVKGDAWADRVLDAVHLLDARGNLAMEFLPVVEVLGDGVLGGVKFPSFILGLEGVFIPFACNVEVIPSGVFGWG
jgi:hypothetical protein